MHTRWDETHRVVCNSCNDEYHDAMLDMAQEVEE